VSAALWARCLVSIGALCATAAAATGLERQVLFTEYSPLSASSEVARRLLSPLANLQIAEFAAKSAITVQDQAIDLARESFTVYVPADPPPQGYGVLAFISPSEIVALPPGWASILDKHRVIFVSASRSGNSTNVLDRRIPLALLGAYNIAQRYPIDPDRVYIGGFSGGSRVAMRVALAYPDLFRGVLLNAGSDPIGNGEALLPSRELFERFQSSSRLVFVTGTVDDWNIEHDFGSRQSMTDWCVYGAAVETMQKRGHEIAVPYFLDRALMRLREPNSLSAAKLGACRERIAADMRAKLQQVEQLIEHDKLHDAAQLLTKIDVHFGGLAAPESIELAQRIGAQR
jgi:pimeloyl-ACP methyl ester carboxylesterase